MPEGKPLTVKEKVLDALTKEGQSYKDLQGKIEDSPTISGLNLALRKLEEDGLALRESITKRGPGYRVGISVDRKHMPRVLWRLK
jgi:hypothetical protein